VTAYFQGNLDCILMYLTNWKKTLRAIITVEYYFLLGWQKIRKDFYLIKRYLSKDGWSIWRVFVL
jgi:hypothetical protein